MVIPFGYGDSIWVFHWTGYSIQFTLPYERNHELCLEGLPIARSTQPQKE